MTGENFRFAITGLVLGFGLAGVSVMIERQRAGFNQEWQSNELIDAGIAALTAQTIACRSARP